MTRIMSPEVARKYLMAAYGIQTPILNYCFKSVLAYPELVYGISKANTKLGR